VPHISSYALTVEPKTALHTFIQKGIIPQPDDEVAAVHFQILVDNSRKKDSYIMSYPILEKRIIFQKTIRVIGWEKNTSELVRQHTVTMDKIEVGMSQIMHCISNRFKKINYSLKLKH
jgi:hypothetical protein